YIFVHLYVLGHLKDPESYRKMLQLMENPLIKLSEVALLALVLAHGLNGVRVTALEMGVPSSKQKTLFWYAFTLGIILFITGSLPLIAGGI
ncbi:MAG: hypothetical protein D6710_09895, partial [Nitrospirae bacterium]